MPAKKQKVAPFAVVVAPVGAFMATNCGMHGCLSRKVPTDPPTRPVLLLLLLVLVLLPVETSPC